MRATLGLKRWVLLALVTSGCAHGGTAAKPASVQAQKPEGYAWTLMERRCRGCHALPDPRTHTRERWVRGIDRMRKRFTLPEADWDSLLALAPADSSPAPSAR